MIGLSELLVALFLIVLFQCWGDVHESSTKHYEAMVKLQEQVNQDVEPWWKMILASIYHVLEFIVETAVLMLAKSLRGLAKALAYLHQLADPGYQRGRWWNISVVDPGPDPLQQQQPDANQPQHGQQTANQQQQGDQGRDWRHGLPFAHGVRLPCHFNEVSIHEPGQLHQQAHVDGDVWVNNDYWLSGSSLNLTSARTCLESVLDDPNPNAEHIRAFMEQPWPHNRNFTYRNVAHYMLSRIEMIARVFPHQGYWNHAEAHLGYQEPFLSGLIVRWFLFAKGGAVAARKRDPCPNLLDQSYWGVDFRYSFMRPMVDIIVLTMNRIQVNALGEPTIPKRFLYSKIMDSTPVNWWDTLVRKANKEGIFSNEWFDIPTNSQLMSRTQVPVRFWMKGVHFEYAMEALRFVDNLVNGIPEPKWRATQDQKRLVQTHYKPNASSFHIASVVGA